MKRWKVSTLKKESPLKAYFIWSIAVLYFLYEFFLQIFLGTIAKEIIQDLSLKVEQFAFIGSALYLSYALMQPKVGMLVDRYGIKKVLLCAVFICVVGVFLFSRTKSFSGAFFARFLIGIGSSFAFISILALSLNWFPKKHFGFFSGLAQFLGSLGPLLAGAPLVFLMKSLNYNWRLILFWMGVMGIAIFLLLLFFLQDKPKGKKKKLLFLDKRISDYQQIKYLFTQRQIWWIFLYAAFIYLTIPLLGAYWGTTYLQTRGFSLTDSAFIISMIWLGMALFAPLMGYFSDKFLRRRPFFIYASLAGLIISLTILYSPINNSWFLSILFFFLGAASSSQTLSFALVTENVSKKFFGIVLGFNNFCIVMFVAIIPPIITFIIRYSVVKEGLMENQFTQASFLKGFIFIPIFYFFALMISFFCIDETYCRQKHEVHKIGNS